MAFSFSNAGQGQNAFGSSGPARAGGQPQAHEGPELQEIQTEEIGFQAIGGEAKLRLLPAAWPEDSLPPPTASLLSVASSRGLLAAAGPDCLVVAKTDTIRDAFRAKSKDNQNIKSFEAEIKLDVPRLSQVAFSADDNVLVVSSQSQGGLAAYPVEGLLKGQTNPSVQIPTHSNGLRSLVPNPASDHAEIFAAITFNGELIIADLKLGALRPGPNGSALKNGVSCLSWSNKGKQLIAGLADATAIQMKPDSTPVAEIPRPPSLEQGRHISAISWLENDAFFVVYSPNESGGGGMIPSSDYYIITRQKNTSHFRFQKLPEACPPFGLERLPAFQFICRLRGFEPNLNELLLVASTNASDIGIITKSSKPLSEAQPVSDEFTTTTIADDSSRAQLPFSSNLADTSPIGLAIDLSSNETLAQPLKSDPDIQYSDTPVPSLLALNNEGILSSWWIVYADSIREKKVYAGMAAIHNSTQNPQWAFQDRTDDTTSSTTTTSAAPTFGRPGFGTTSIQDRRESTTSSESIPTAPPFGQPGFGLQPNEVTTTPGAPKFGQPGFGNAEPFVKPPIASFGLPALSSGLGTSSTLGSGASPWTTTGFGDAGTSSTGTGFGQPTFGSSTPIGGSSAPAFGTASALNNRSTAFGLPPAPAATPAFGQVGFGENNTGSLSSGASGNFFAPKEGTGDQSSGFAAFSSSGGFSRFAARETDHKNIFATPATESPFSKPTTAVLSGATTGNEVGTDAAQPAANAGLLGVTRGRFNLGSTFEPDRSPKDDIQAPASGGKFGFGPGLADLLNETPKELSPTHDEEADMADGGENDAHGAGAAIEQDLPEPAPLPPDPSNLITPPSTVIQSKATPAPPLSNLFGTTTQPNTTPAEVGKSKPTWAFPQAASTTPKDSPQLKRNPFMPTLEKEEDKAEDLPPLRRNPFLPVLEKKEDTSQIKTERSSSDDTVALHDIPEAPLPPEPTSKTSYSAGDTSVSSINSKDASEDTVGNPDFEPANKTAIQDAANEVLLHDSETSSDFEGVPEDESGDVSPIEEATGELTDQLETSPESSFGRGGEKSPTASPTGGLFTKVDKVPQKPSRPLFGEIGSGPILPPPKNQQSPRSPSPVRHIRRTELLRPDSSRSVSAPSRPSIVERKKSKDGKPVDDQPSNRFDDLFTQRQARLARDVAKKAEEESQASQPLIDDEAEQVRRELARPVSPSPELGNFVYHSPTVLEPAAAKSGIPGQIERLYQDINSMIDSLGINARSLSAFILFQQTHQSNIDWPDVLLSDVPLDDLSTDRILSFVTHLHAGTAFLSKHLSENHIPDLPDKLATCHRLFNSAIPALRTDLISTRKALNAAATAENSAPSAPLTTEQSALQTDLRRSFARVQAQLSQTEQAVAILRAKITELSPSSSETDGVSNPTNGSPRKPTVEAVTSTIAKMTAMAERRSAEVDILEAHMRKLNLLRADDPAPATNGASPTTLPPRTPPPPQQKMMMKKKKPDADRLGASGAPGQTPGSVTSGPSVYHTPTSHFSGSTGTGTGPAPGRRRRRLGASRVDGQGSLALTLVVPDAEERERWRARTQWQSEVRSMLREAVVERRQKRAAAAAAAAVRA